MNIIVSRYSFCCLPSQGTALAESLHRLHLASALWFFKSFDFDYGLLV